MDIWALSILQNIISKGSSKRANNKGERTHSCMEALEIEVEDEKVFLVMILADGI